MPHRILLKKSLVSLSRERSPASLVVLIRLVTVNDNSVRRDSSAKCGHSYAPVSITGSFSPAEQQRLWSRSAGRSFIAVLARLR